MRDTANPQTTDFIKKLDVAVQVLMVAWEDHHASEIADALDILSDYRAQYVQDNSQFGVGA